MVGPPPTPASESNTEDASTPPDDAVTKARDGSNASSVPFVIVTSIRTNCVKPSVPAAHSVGVKGSAPETETASPSG